MAEAPKVNGRLNLSQPRWDQSTYLGRAKHFFNVTDPRTLLASSKELDEAFALVEAYNKGEEPAGTTEEQVWAAKKLRESSFHPQTGEKQFIIGRMSFQVPGNMITTGGMLAFYQSTPAVILWQWINQSFNCIVNYTNRNASASITPAQLTQAYIAACGASVFTAVGLKRFVNSSPRLAGGVVGRLVPFVAVAAANCVNIPLMRQRELVNGITVSTEDEVPIGNSKTAARSAVGQVVPSRILMATPGLVLPAIAMASLSKRPLLAKNPWLGAPITVALAGACLIFSTPLCCALFPQ
eukprot:Ihof_evm6s97 gene=Ihof_evmTU6s97